MAYIVGLVYKNNGRYFLAVDREILLTGDNGRLEEVQPGRKFTIARDISVGELCEHWGVDTYAMDVAVERHMAPSEAGRIRAESSDSIFVQAWERKWADRRRTGQRIADEKAPSRRQTRRYGNVRRGRFVRLSRLVG